MCGLTTDALLPMLRLTFLSVIYFLTSSLLCTPRVDGVRLAGSGVDYTGRLEVYNNGQWGTVCDDHFDDNDAAVACYMLGFGYVHLKVNYGRPME